MLSCFYIYNIYYQVTYVYHSLSSQLNVLGEKLVFDHNSNLHIKVIARCLSLMYSSICKMYTRTFVSVAWLHPIFGRLSVVREIIKLFNTCTRASMPTCYVMFYINYLLFVCWINRKWLLIFRRAHLLSLSTAAMLDAALALGSWLWVDIRKYYILRLKIIFYAAHTRYVICCDWIVVSLELPTKKQLWSVRRVLV